jgi:hypothetical protein
MTQKINIEALSTVDNQLKVLKAIATDLHLLIAAVNEINTWAETLAAKLNLDSGVGDTDYDATITAGQITTSVAVTK